MRTTFHSEKSHLLVRNEVNRTKKIHPSKILEEWI